MNILDETIAGLLGVSQQHVHQLFAGHGGGILFVFKVSGRWERFLEFDVEFVWLNCFIRRALVAKNTSLTWYSAKMRFTQLHRWLSTLSVCRIPAHMQSNKSIVYHPPKGPCFNKWAPVEPDVVRNCHDYMNPQDACPIQKDDTDNRVRRNHSTSRPRYAHF